MKKNTLYFRRLLVFIIFLGALIRIIGLWHRDLWFDEAYSYHMAKLPLPTLISTSLFDNTPPFYYLLLKIFLLLEESELFLRLPSLILGIFSIPLCFLVTSKMSSNKKYPLLTTAFVALSPLLVYYSQEARPYALLTFIFLLMLYFFFLFLEKNTLLARLMLIFSTFLALFTSYFTLIFIIIINLFYFFQLKRQRKKFSDWLFIQVSISPFILLTCFIYFFLPHSTPWGLALREKIIVPFASQAASGIGVFTLRSLFYYPQPLGIKILAAGLIIFLNIFFILGIFLAWKKERNLAYYPLIGFIFPFLLSLILSLWQPLFSPRLFIPLSFFFYFGASVGIVFLLSKLSQNLKTIALAFIFLSLISYSLIQNIHLIFKGEPLRQAATFLKENSQKGEIIAHSSISTFYPFSYYQKTLSHYLVAPSQLAQPISQAIGGEVIPLNQIAQNQSQIWFVNFPHRVEPIDEKKAFDYLDKFFKLVEQQNFGNLEIYHWQRNE